MGRAEGSTFTQVLGEPCAVGLVFGKLAVEILRGVSRGEADVCRALAG